MYDKMFKFVKDYLEDNEAETGALSVVWDCMMEGSAQIQTFEKTYNHIMNYSYKSLKVNPMVTDKSKAFYKLYGLLFFK